jgi:hypothetical protein
MPLELAAFPDMRQYRSSNGTMRRRLQGNAERILTTSIDLPSALQLDINTSQSETTGKLIF